MSFSTELKATVGVAEILANLVQATCVAPSHTPEGCANHWNAQDWRITSAVWKNRPERGCHFLLPMRKQHPGRSYAPILSVSQ